MRFFYSLAFFLSIIVINAQNVSDRSIDSLMEVSKQDFAGAKFLKSLELANKAQGLSEKLSIQKALQFPMYTLLMYFQALVNITTPCTLSEGPKRGFSA